MEELVGASLKGRRIFLTGHTGFKGGYLALWLAQLGAEVRGYALDPPAAPNLFTVARIAQLIEDRRGDILELAHLASTMKEFHPEVVFHLAAQPLVRRSYADPLGTYATNVMGTANLLECARQTPSVRAIVVVTSDKCYENREWPWGYRETDALGGHDPYSSSKACAELVTSAFRSSFFPPDRIAEHHVALATARAGNVIGGGDWAEDRLVPDLIRGFIAGRPVEIRNPTALRPWQHVLEPLSGYIILAERLLQGDASLATAWNFGPAEEDVRPVAWIARELAERWGEGASWIADDGAHPHEAASLKLDCARARDLLHWRPKLDIDAALHMTVSWSQDWRSGAEMQGATMDQIHSYRRR